MTALERARKIRPALGDIALVDVEVEGAPLAPERSAEAITSADQRTACTHSALAPAALVLSAGRSTR